MPAVQGAFTLRLVFSYWVDHVWLKQNASNLRSHVDTGLVARTEKCTGSMSTRHDPVGAPEPSVSSDNKSGSNEGLHQGLYDKGQWTAMLYKTAFGRPLPFPERLGLRIANPIDTGSMIYY